jgi:hypothetical protein
MWSIESIITHYPLPIISLEVFFDDRD